MVVKLVSQQVETVDWVFEKRVVSGIFRFKWVEITGSGRNLHK
jgi:hypothetical protein